MIRIAVIADPHVHDCSWRPTGTGLAAAWRSHADTVASTRVFNESLPAFRAALGRAAAEGAGIVLLVGDLTDDGQAPNIAAAMALIRSFRDSHGLRVLATPGNHDLFALHGRPQDKEFLDGDGRPVLLSSAECPEAATLGTAEALELMQSLGYQPAPGDLHWESPFGRDPSWSARQYEVYSPDRRTVCRMIDSSYLVEPVPGLWVLGIDANVCPPRNGGADLRDPAGFTDPSAVGWPAVLHHRAHLMPWITDVAARARAQGKQLVAFSHYPLLDVLAGTGAEDCSLFDGKGSARRLPPPEVADAFAATGVRLHFSGHLHVNDTARHGDAAQGFFNISVPSPVGFAPAMKLVDLQGDRVAIRSLPLRDHPGHDAAFPAYRAEAARAGRPVPAAAEAPDHGTFLDRHLVELAHNRYLPREWPRDMAAFVRNGRTADLLRLLNRVFPGAPDLPLTLLAEDFYRLRKAGTLAHDYIPPDRMAFYQALTADLPVTHQDELAARFIRLLRILRRYMRRLPNADFTLDLTRLTVVGQ